MPEPLTVFGGPFDRLEARVRTLWRIKGLIAVAVVGAAAAAVGAAAAGWAGAVAAGLAVAAAGAALVIGLTGVAWQAWGYRVGDEALVVRHGVIVRTESSVPYRRIQHIDIESGPLQRSMGLRTLVLRTAAAGSDGTIPGIDEADAESLRARILARTGEDDAV